MVVLGRPALTPMLWTSVSPPLPLWPVLRDTIRFTEPICLRFAHIFLFCDWKSQGNALRYTVTEGTTGPKSVKGQRGEWHGKPGAVGSGGTGAQDHG